jgi:hypothetical protein
MKLAAIAAVFGGVLGLMPRDTSDPRPVGMLPELGMGYGAKPSKTWNPTQRRIRDRAFNRRRNRLRRAAGIC